MARKRSRLYGNAISPGIGKGKVCIWGPVPVPKRRKIRVGQVPVELARLEDAIKISKSQLKELQSRVTQDIGSEESKIFEVPFNGDSENQLKILKALFENHYSVLEFSVPKVNLLESLFIGLTKESYWEALYHDNQILINHD